MHGSSSITGTHNTNNNYINFQNISKYQKMIKFDPELVYLLYILETKDKICRWYENFFMEMFEDIFLFHSLSKSRFFYLNNRKFC